MKKQLLAIAVVTALTTGVMAANVSDNNTSKQVTSSTTSTATANTASTAKTKAIKMVKQKVPKTAMVTLDSTEVFKVTLGEEVSTKTNKIGDYVPFTVTNDVMVGNVLVIPAGTTGEAKISSLKKARSFGRNASMDLDFDSITAIDGTTFAGMQGSEAQEKTKSTLKAAGASVAGVALLGPVGLVGGFFVKGKSITIPAGTDVFIQPTAPVSIVGQIPGQYEEIEVPVETEVTGTTSSEATVGTEKENPQHTKAAINNNEANDTVAATKDKDTKKVDNQSSESDANAEAVEEEPEDIPTSPIIIVKRTE